MEYETRLYSELELDVIADMIERDYDPLSPEEIRQYWADRGIVLEDVLESA